MVIHSYKIEGSMIDLMNRRQIKNEETTMQNPMHKWEPVYKHRYEKALGRVSCELRMVTPEWAQQALDNCKTKNRPKTTASIKKLVREMERGAWWPNGEAIVFDTDGNLINGQHRLTAIVEYGHAIPVLVIYGIAPEAFYTFDQGRNRGNADVLAIGGAENTNMLAAAIRWQLKYDSGELGSHFYTPIANDEILTLAAQFPQMPEAVKVANQINKRVPQVDRLINPSCLAFLYHNFSALNQTLADEFFSRSLESLNVVKPSWEYFLNRRLKEFVGKRTGAIQVEIAALAIKAWNKIRQGAVPGNNNRLSWGKDESFPQIQ